MLDSDKFAAKFTETDMRLKALTDQDPWAAINAARELRADDVLNQPAIDMIAAGTLIDAGAIARDRDAVTEGVRLLEDRPIFTVVDCGSRHVAMTKCHAGSYLLRAYF